VLGITFIKNHFLKALFLVFLHSHKIVTGMQDVYFSGYGTITGFILFHQ
jgi:hypothetical protein